MALTKTNVFIFASLYCKKSFLFLVLSHKLFFTIMKQQHFVCFLTWGAESWISQRSRGKAMGKLPFLSTTGYDNWGHRHCRTSPEERTHFPHHPWPTMYFLAIQSLKFQTKLYSRRYRGSWGPRQPSWRPLSLCHAKPHWLGPQQSGS